MLRFFQLDSCLSYNLARYFDDHDAPGQRGHCSVCEGKIAQLTQIFDKQQIEQQHLSEQLMALQALINEHGFTLSETLAARFFTGLTQPLFSKSRATKLPGFATYDKVPFAEVKAAVSNAL